VVVASVQTAGREARLRRLIPDFETLIVDEAHHLTAPSYQRILGHLGAGREGGPQAVGFTATPERGGGQPLDGWGVVYRRELLEMIREGYLADIRALQVRLEADFSKLHTRAGDFIDKESEDLLLGADAPKHDRQGREGDGGGVRGGRRSCGVDRRGDAAGRAPRTPGRLPPRRHPRSRQLRGADRRLR
jgi:superfamily II DNA or RNA helicase